MASSEGPELGEESLEKLVVVGAGLAGLTAAYRASTLRPLVLKRNPWVGGRTHSENLGDGLWVNLGAFWLPESALQLARELGVEVNEDPLPPPALFIGGKRIIETGHIRWFLELPLSLRARFQFLKTVVRLLLAVRRIRAGGGQELNDVTLAEWLGPLQPDMEELVLPMATMVGATDISTISARVGLDVVSAAIGRMTYHGASYTTVVGGTGLLAENIAARLGERVITNANVTRVSQNESEVQIAFTANGSDSVVRAEQCVLAVPVTEMLVLCDGLPEDKADAFRALKPVTAISLGLIIEGAPDAPWDRMYWLHTAGTIKSLVNDEYFSRRRRPPEAKRVFSLIISGEQAREVWHLSDDDLTDLVITRFVDIFPEAAGYTSVGSIVRHKPAMVSGPPGMERELSLRSEPVGRIHFCGADLAGVGTDLTIRSGESAAAQVLSGVSN